MKTTINSFSALIFTIGIICINSLGVLAEGNDIVPPLKIADPEPFITHNIGREDEIKPVVKHELTLLELQELVTFQLPAEDPNQTLHLGNRNGHFANATCPKHAPQLTIYKLNFK
jgi:hypothetical protein